MSYYSWGSSCRSYQLGVVGGDREGRLLVSRCSDEIDLCSTGFQTIPPTTRWYPGILQIWKEKHKVVFSIYHKNANIHVAAQAHL